MSKKNSRQNTEYIWCKPCNKRFTGPAPLTEHQASIKHKKKCNETIPTPADKKQALPSSQINPQVSLSSSIELPSMNEMAAMCCEICDKIFSGKIQYYQHLQSNVHQKKQKQKILKNELLQKNCLETTSKTIKVQLVASNSSDFQIAFSCETCSKTFTGAVPFSQHLKSNYHEKKMKNKLLENILKSKSLSITINSESPESPALQKDLPQSKKNVEINGGKQCYECKPCKKVFSGPVPYNQHISSTTHQKKLTFPHETLLVYSQNSNPDEVLKKASNDGAGGAFSYCEFCQKKFLGFAPFKEHLLSSNHKKQIEKFESRTKANIAEPVDQKSKDILEANENIAEILNLSALKLFVQENEQNSIKVKFKKIPGCDACKIPYFDSVESWTSHYEKRICSK